MSKIDAAVFSKVDLTEEQQEHLQELKGSIDELLTDEADITQLRTAYETYIESCFDYREYEKAREGLNFINDNSAAFELTDSETANLRRQFGVLAFSGKDIDTAKVEFTKGFELLEDSTEENEPLKAKLLCDLGNVASVEENYREAMEYYEAAIELNEENDIDVATPFYNLGLIYLASQNYDDAADCFEAALEIFQEEENSEQEEAMHLQLGSIYFAQDNFTDALRNYHYATELQEENSEALGKTYVSMVSILLKMGENEKAVEFYEKALPILEQNSDIELQSEHYFQIANLYNRYLENYEKAIKYYEKSLTIAKTDEENDEWRDLMVAKLEDSINENKEKLKKKSTKKSGFLGRLFGR